MINLADFQKLDIRIGTVIAAEKVPEAERLVGKQTPVLVNIEPRILRGYESQGKSQGMIIAVDVDGQSVLLHPEKAVPTGSIVI